MRFILLILSVNLALSLYGQSDTLSFKSFREIDSFKVEKADFNFVLSDSLNQKMLAGSYRHGHKAGTWIFFLGNTSKTGEWYIVNDSVTNAVEYDPLGKKQWQGQLLKGKRNGTWVKNVGTQKKYFIYQNGKLIYEAILRIEF